MGGWTNCCSRALRRVRRPPDSRDCSAAPDPLPIALRCSPWSRLAGLAHIGPAAGDDHLHDRGPTVRTWFAGSPVHEKAVLKRAAHAIDVAKIVDRGAARLDAVAQYLDDRLAQTS